MNVNVSSGRASQSSASSDDGSRCCGSLRGAPLEVTDAETLAAGFSALADPVRLRLLSLIAEAGEVCSCDLVGPLGRSQPTVSHHTKLLSEAGLIVGEKRGRWVWWRLVPDRLDELRAAVAPVDRADSPA